MMKTRYRLEKRELESRKRKTLTGHYAYHKFNAERRHEIIAAKVLKDWKPLGTKR